MDRIKGLKVLGLAGVIALGAGLAMSSSTFAQDAKKSDAKKEPHKKEGAKTSNKAKPNMGVYGTWVKELGLDEATQEKLIALHNKQEEATKEKSAKISELTKAMREDQAAGKKDEAKAKNEELTKLRAEVAKSNGEFHAQAFALLTPEQQKKITVATAFKAATMTAPFKQVKLSADQEKKVMDKLEASMDAYINEDKEVDNKKLVPIVKALADEVLTADQKAEVTRQQEEAKARGAAKKAEGAAKTEKPAKK